MSKRYITASTASFAGGCGVTMIHNYQWKTPETEATKAKEAEFARQHGWAPWKPPMGKPLKDQYFANGGGIVMGSFINDDRCKGAYDAMCSKYPIFMQTEPRPNSYHNGRKFFIAAWDIKKKAK